MIQQNKILPRYRQTALIFPNSKPTNVRDEAPDDGNRRRSGSRSWRRMRNSCHYHKIKIEWNKYKRKNIGGKRVSILGPAFLSIELITHIERRRVAPLCTVRRPRASQPLFYSYFALNLSFVSFVRQFKRRKIMHEIPTTTDEKTDMRIEIVIDQRNTKAFELWKFKCVIQLLPLPLVL